MRKFVKVILAVFVVLLGANAGIDITTRLQRRAIEKQIESEITAIPALATSTVNSCYDIRGEGWLCDITLRSNDGREIRGAKMFTYEQLGQ